jgi:hypothetical protein
MYGVWGTADAPVVIQRDPAAAADPNAPGAFIDIADIGNCSYIYFKDINFKARGSPAGNVVRIMNR